MHIGRGSGEIQWPARKRLKYLATGEFCDVSTYDLLIEPQLGSGKELT